MCQEKLKIANKNQHRKRKKRKSFNVTIAKRTIALPTRPKRIAKVAVSEAVDTALIVRACNKELIENVDNWEQLKNEDFLRLFRMQKASFCNILQSYEHFRQNQQNVKHLEIINQAPHSKILLIFLLYAGHQISQALLAEKLKIYRKTVTACIDNALDYFLSLAVEKIQLPQGSEERQTNADEFAKIAGIKGVIGCIEKLYFRFVPHDNYAAVDKKYNQFYVELACDAFGRFIAYNNDTLDSRLEQACQGDYCFLASLKFALREWTITPCPDDNHLDAVQQLFNEKFLQTFEVLHKAVDGLQRRFRQLVCIDTQRLTFARRFLHACIGLHNFLLECEDDHFSLDDDADLGTPNENWQPLKVTAMSEDAMKQSALDRFSCPRGLQKRDQMIIETCILAGALEECEAIGIIH